MTSRRYIKRVWRVPKDRGAPTYLAALLAKLLVKHGWPAKADPREWTILVSYEGRSDLPPDFENALDIAVRVISRTYRVDIAHHGNGYVDINRPYVVTKGGFFRESTYEQN